MKPWSWFIQNADGSFSADPEKVGTFDCPKCGEGQIRPKGSVDLAAPPICEDCREGHERAEQARKDRERSEARIEGAGVPIVYRRGFVAPPEWPRLASGASIEKWRGDPWCLTFFGVTGAGKSYLASHLFCRLVAGGQRFASTIEDEAPPIRGTWILAPLAAERLFGPKSYETFDRLATCEVLMIDEFGRELSPTAREKISAILGARYANQLPTLITSNLPPAGTEQRPGIARIDPALARRLDLGAWVEMSEKWGAR